MQKRAFLRLVVVGLIAVAAASVFSGCMAPRVGKNVLDTQSGDPYRCGRCGHLTRSTTDITGERCPRCRARMLKRITEEEMAEYLKNETPAL